MQTITPSWCAAHPDKAAAALNYLLENSSADDYTHAQKILRGDAREQLPAKELTVR